MWHGDILALERDQEPFDLVENVHRDDLGDVVVRVLRDVFLVDLQCAIVHRLLNELIDGELFLVV